jgi:hypothetical protein
VSGDSRIASPRLTNPSATLLPVDNFVTYVTYLFGLDMSTPVSSNIPGCSNRKPLELGDVYFCASYLSDNSLNMSEHSDDMWSVGSHLRCDVIPD